MMTIGAVLAVLAVSAHASPFPQAVTAAIAPAGARPAGCSEAFSGKFGIAVVPVSDKSKAAQSHRSHSRSHIPAAISQISDGQVQNHETTTSDTSSSESLQSAPETPFVTVVTERSTILGSNQLSTISDGQVQGPTGHENMSTLTSTYTTMMSGKASQSKRELGSHEEKSHTASVSEEHTGSQTSEKTPQETSQRFCGSDSTLTLTMDKGMIHDVRGRTGYIASNYQFQFDGPPQAGALYTSGFSVCEDNRLALGPSTVWYQCRSGDFYNLYDRNWAAQCEPIELQVVHLEDC